MTARILAIFLILSVASLAVLGFFANRSIKGVGGYALQSSSELGNNAINDSTVALEELGEDVIRQKALDVAKQVDSYLKAHPDVTVADLSRDQAFREIAVQPVGVTGYTAVLDAARSTIVVHKFPSSEGKNVADLKTTLPSFWALAEVSADGSSTSGYYDWIEPDGSVTKKYAYVASDGITVGGDRLTVWATTYIDEFSKPAQDTREKIDASIASTSQHIDSQINNAQNAFVAIFFAMIVVVFVLAFWLARTITRPVVALTRGARVIGGGDLDHRVELKTRDEIEDLANSFNKMASNLKQHMEELRQTTAEKERVQKELEIARGIQQSFLPESAPIIDGIELAALNVPAKEVGGDFYDFIPIPAGKWGLVIADVSGKGVPAALFMALSRTLVRANVAGRASASEAIMRSNDLMAEDDRNNMFVTLFYGVLDPAKRTLSYVNAGHNSPLMLQNGRSDIILLEAKGIALGVMQNIELEEKEIALRDDDVVVLYTDGVTEAMNDLGEQFGQQRLTGIIARNRHLPAQELMKLIQKEVVAFSQGQPQFDDITLMILKAVKAETTP